MSCLRENLTSSSYGEGLETGEETQHRASPLPDNAGTSFQGRDDDSLSHGIRFPAGQQAAFVTIRPSNATSLDLSGFNTLLILMRGSGVVKIGIKDRNQPNNGTEVKLPVTLTPDWRAYAFPLILFRTANPAVPNLVQLFVRRRFVNDAPTPVTAFVGDVRYTSVPAPQIGHPPRSSEAQPLSIRRSHWIRETIPMSAISIWTRGRSGLRFVRSSYRLRGLALRGVFPVQWCVFDTPQQTGDFAGEYSAIKVDDQGNVHVAFWSLHGPRYCGIHGQTPVIQELIEARPGAGMYISLEIKSLGDARGPEVAYYDAGIAPATAGRLKVARRANGRWTTPEVVDANGDVGGFASIQQDSVQRPLIAYYDFDRQRVRLATSTTT